MSAFFVDKVAIVTGSSNGIGRSAARLFAAAGAKVTITGRNPKALAETKSECLAAGAKEENLLEVVGDVRDEKFLQKLIDVTVAKFGNIDILVNNAGAGIYDEKERKGIDIPINNYDVTMEINVRSVLLLSQLAVPYLEKTNGSVINVSSISGFLYLNPILPYYHMSKAALDSLTVQMAGTLIKKGIRVNSVNPGVIKTNFFANGGLSDEKEEKNLAKLVEGIPSGKIGVPDDVGKVILFLADKTQSDFIVGQRITVDGGTLIMNKQMSQ